MAEASDLGKMVSMIMENPSLMAELRRMAGGVEAEDNRKEEAAPVPVVATEPPPARAEGKRERRHRLMGAIREYLSEPRAKAVDTMMSLFDIIDLVGGK